MPWRERKDVGYPSLATVALLSAPRTGPASWRASAITRSLAPQKSQVYSLERDSGGRRVSDYGGRDSTVQRIVPPWQSRADSPLKEASKRRDAPTIDKKKEMKQLWIQAEAG
ncbi:hypothetical protein BC827DRAFT_1157316 [Russula dissimulans]|nr:hypothetical protein BC827DRAFT_1157316 [Russula dissimulans]